MTPAWTSRTTCSCAASRSARRECRTTIIWIGRYIDPHAEGWGDGHPRRLSAKAACMTITRREARPDSGDATEEGRCMRTMLFYEACTVLYEELATRASIETLISHASGVATYNSYIQTAVANVGSSRVVYVARRSSRCTAAARRRPTPSTVRPWAPRLRSRSSPRTRPSGSPSTSPPSWRATPSSVSRRSRPRSSRPSA